MTGLSFENLHASAALGEAPMVVSTQLSVVLEDFLVEARAGVRDDPSTADRWLDRFERILARTVSPEVQLEPAGLRTGGLAPWQVLRIKQHVEANLSVRLNTSELASLVRLSENHFARAFKASVGSPPHAYVVQRRILCAKRLILDTDLPLSQVALEAGMSDQAHLSRLFRRFFGVSPSAFRRHNGVPTVIAVDLAA